MSAKRMSKSSYYSSMAFFIAIILFGCGIIFASVDKKNFDETIDVVSYYLTIDRTFGNSWGFKKISDDVNKTYYEYKTGDKKDDVYKYLPKNDATEQYKKSFFNRLFIISDSMNKIKDDKYSREEQEKLIEDFSEDLLKVKRTFLSGYNFDPVKDYVSSTGSVVNDSGVNKNILTNLSQKQLDQEKKVRDLYIVDGLGDYREVGEHIAGIFDVEVVYGFDSMSKNCVNNDKNKKPDRKIAGKFCSAQEDVNKIFVNNDADGQRSYSQPSYIDTVKHELSHHLINKRCSTTSPEITKDMSEAVTSSYATIYLGGNYDVYQNIGESNPEYKMTAETDKIARGIHDQGLCYPK